MPAAPLIGALALSLGLLMIMAGLRRESVRTQVERRLMRFTAAADGAPAARPHMRARWRAAAPLARFGRLVLTNPADREKLAQRLFATGIENADGPYVFAAVRLVLVLLGFGAATALLWGGKNALAYAALAGGLAYVLPGRVLGSIASGRAAAVRRELPFALDLIQLAIGGGSSIEQAMRFCAQLDPHPAPRVRGTVRRLLEDLGRGMSYETAIDRWGRRLGVEEGADLAEMFRQSLLHGAELSPGLRTLVGEFSERRLTKAREAIGRKSTKLTIVMVVFFLPVLMLLLGAPAFTAILKALGGLTRP